MKTIKYKLAKKQLVGDGHYVKMPQADYDALVEQFVRIGDIMGANLDPELRRPFDRWLNKPCTHGVRGVQTNRDFIIGIIKQKGILGNDWSTRQLDATAAIYNTFAPGFDLEPVEFCDQEALDLARAESYSAVFERLQS